MAQKIDRPTQDQVGDGTKIGNPTNYDQSDLLHVGLIGTGVHVSDGNGKTALFSAVLQSNNDSVVRALIDAGADVNETDKYGKTAMFRAVQQSDNVSVVRALIDAGGNVNMTDYDGRTALFSAVLQCNNDSVVCALIDAGADVNVTDKYGKTAMFRAVQQRDNVSVVRALIDAGTNVNMTDNDGRTALFRAVQQSDNESVVRALIDAGTNVNMADNDERTALFFAVQQRNNESVFRILINAGADVNMAERNGRTALFYAVQESDNESVVRALIDNVACRDTYGRTAHFYVTWQEPSSLLSLLLQGGNPKLKLKDNCGVDILSFFIEKWLSTSKISVDYFIDEILDEFAKHGIPQERFSKAIVNIIFLKSVFVFNRNVQDLFPAPGNLLTLGKLYKEFTRGNESLQKEAKMKRVMKVFKARIDGRYMIADKEKASEVLEILVELDADPDSVDADGNTFLHHTTRLPLLGVPQKTVMDLCNLLKRFGVLFNKRNHQRQTALLFCLSAEIHQLTDEVFSSAVKTLVLVCQFLVNQGSSMDETSKTGESVFHLTIKFLRRCFKVKNEAIRKEVLQESMKLLHLFSPWKVALKDNIINKPNFDLNTPLHFWASTPPPPASDEDGSFKTLLDKILNYLLACGAKVNARNEKDETPLHLCQTWTAVKLLIRSGANPKDVDSSGRPPLLAAARNAKKSVHLDVFPAAAVRGPIDSKPDHLYPDVAEEPKVFWKTAVQMGLDPWKVDKNGKSVLSILVELENFVLSKALVEVAREEDYSNSQKDVVHLLNAICMDGSTRSHWKTVLVQDILKYWNLPSTTYNTPLRHCVENITAFGVLATNSSNQNEDFKVESSADDTPATKGETAENLQTVSAASNDSVHYQIANLLLSYGARVDESCLHIADSHPALKEFLTKPFDRKAVPKLIPWTSTSTKYEDRLAKVARRQECDVVNTIWYHTDHIGKGSFGHIFAGINEKDGREVAVKRIVKLNMERPEDKREIQNLTALADCEQVVRYILFFEDKHFSYIVLELMEGDLEEYLTGSAIDDTQAAPLCKDVVMGMMFLHDRKILHRDLKPQNILYKVRPRLCLKIADFGLSRLIGSKSTTVYGTLAGTRCWIAPEVLKSKINKADKNCFEPASDMFSCGLILHYILSGQKHPFNPTDCTNKSELQITHETEDNLMKGKAEGWDDSLSPEATHLVKGMLECNEKHRPIAEEALEHPLFWSNERKIDFLKTVGNQEEFQCPRSLKTSPLTSVEADLEISFSTLVANQKCKRPWDDPAHAQMPDIYAGMTTGKGRKIYDTSSAVELVRFIRNVYEHYREKVFLTLPIEKMLFEDFVFLEYFPDLVMEVYKAVTTHGWDKTRDEVKSNMKKK